MHHDNYSHVYCIKKSKLQICVFLVALPTWRRLLTNEQDDSEEQQMCGRKTCTRCKDDSAASQAEHGVYGHGNCDYSTLPQLKLPVSPSFNKQPALETLVLSDL